MSAAARTGYALAPTPRSDLLVDGIYLVPADASLRHACIRAAHVAGFPVPCPSLMPYPPTSVGGCGGVTRCYRSGEFVLEGNFVGPPEYVGNDAGSGHLWFLAATPAKRADVECFSGKREAATVTVRGHPGHWLVCPPGSELNSGHVILEWPEHGVVYAISLHGDSAPNRRLDLALARRSALVR